MPRLTLNGLFIVLPLLVLAACSQPSADSQTGQGKAEVVFTAEEIAAESAKANALFEEAFQVQIDRSPIFQTILGIKKDYGKWDEFTDERAKEDLEIRKSFLARLHGEIRAEALDEQTRVSYQLFEEDIKEDIDGFKYRFHNYPISQFFGIHTQVPALLMNSHTIADESDARAYVSRLEGVRKLFEQLMTGLKTREEMGIIPPAFAFPKVLNATDNVLRGKPFDGSGEPSALLADFTRKLDALADLDPTVKDELIAAAESALLSGVKPAYENLIAYIKNLGEKATEDDGCWKFPDGGAFYNFALRQNTSTDLTAEEIHETGLNEVARIHDEMRQIMAKVHFEGDLKAFFEFVKTDPQFYLPNTDEGRQTYLDQTQNIINNMKTRLDEVFITKPKADLVVKRVEAYREETATTAFYESPAQDGSRPGTYYVNLYQMADMPPYQMEALAYHEAIPGHHMQIAIAQELTGLPKFRRFGNYTAYSEGWGLYSELLPKEMGLYQDPYSDFGRLSMELWRACRLVVDTGIHAKRWTRKKALDYVLENTPQPEGDCIKEIERYIVWPGQATAYKVGMLKIHELREQSKQALGEAFDIRKFHEVVLANGPVPLSVLETMVKRWQAEVGG